MTMPGVIKFVYDCGAQVVQGDGMSCVPHMTTGNWIVLAAGVGMIIYGIKKKDKIKKAYGSFLSMCKKRW